MSKTERGLGTRALLDQLAEGDPGDVLELGKLLDGLGARAFGVLLFLAIPPSFFPGVAAVIGSPVIVLVGLHLLLRRRQVWLPDFLARRGPHRELIIRFDRRFAPWLAKLERFVRPRWPALLDHPLAGIYTGLLLVLLGILLALPIPFTNVVFALLLLLVSLGLLERDGRLMLVAWITGSIAVLVFGILSGELAARAAWWIDRFVF